MSEQGARVALLAREGEARERLQAALGDAGADVVAVADPLTASIGDVTAAAPRAVLVALEPEIEDALEGWGALLSDPAIAVIFDEAELAANRSGWDAARWVRHLRAKLNNHDDVLPPGTEPEDEWGLMPGPLEEEPQKVVAESGAAGDGGPDQGPVVSAGGLALEGEEELQDARLSPDRAADDGLPADEGLEAWLEKMSATLEVGHGPDASAAPQSPQPEAGQAAAQPGRPAFNLDGLSLADEYGPAAGADPGGVEAPSLESLEERISGLSLVDVDSYGHGPERGAVLVEAGLGGPDAVRQLLAALDAGFPRPLLVRMRLDGGRYDRLVRQMDRATSLTVALAEAGGAIEPGHVYFLPPGIGPVREKGELRFASTASPGGLLPEDLPADDSAILLLSGSDPALVDEAMARAGDGVLVLGQAPEDNFDPAASNLLRERGGSTAAPSEIAAQLLERWMPASRPAAADLEDQDL